MWLWLTSWFYGWHDSRDLYRAIHLVQLNAIAHAETSLARQRRLDLAGAFEVVPKDEK